MEFCLDVEYCNTVKAALKATLLNQCDYIVYVDASGTYGFMRGSREAIVSRSPGVKLLGWTEYSVVCDIPKANFLEFEVPLSAECNS